MAKIIRKSLVVKNYKWIIKNYVAGVGYVVWVKHFQDFLIEMPQFAFKFFHSSPPDKRIVRLDYVAAEIDAICCWLENLLFGVKFEPQFGFHKSFDVIAPYKQLFS